MDERPKCFPYDFTKWLVVLHECKLGWLKRGAVNNLAPNTVIRAEGVEDLFSKVVACAQKRSRPEGKTERELAVDLPKSL